MNEREGEGLWQGGGDGVLKSWSVDTGSDFRNYILPQGQYGYSGHVLTYLPRELDIAVVRNTETLYYHVLQSHPSTH